MLCKVMLNSTDSESRTDLDNEDDINQLDSSGEVSNQSSSDQAECIKGNCNCRPKTINVISQDQEFILDTLRKVEDEKTKQNLYEVFKKSIIKIEAKKIRNPYNLNDILNSLTNPPKEVSIKELHDELRQFIGLGLSDLQEQINRIVNQGNLMDIPESSHVNDNETDTFSNTMSRVIFQRWEVSLTIVVKDKFVFDIIALIDSGATENCLQEGLVPIPLCEETSQTLFGANGKRLAIKYKLTDQTFILVKDLKEKALLGIPFLSSIYPLWVDNQESFMKGPYVNWFCKIKHNDKFSNMGLAFSTCHIYKILIVKQWGGNPNLSREFSEPSKPSKFGLAWIVQWDYIIIADESAAFPTLERTFKTKWWDTLKNDASIDAVKQYFLKNPTQVSASDDMSRSSKQHYKLCSQIKTPQDFQKIYEEGSSNFSQENSYAESDDSTSYLPDNGDDCEGILPLIRRSNKHVTTQSKVAINSLLSRKWVFRWNSFVVPSLFKFLWLFILFIF
ncbi:hypothetical protein AAG906_018963 [Vitis piasezkii]